MTPKWPIVCLGDVLIERKELPSSRDLISGRVKIISKIIFDKGLIETRSDGETKTNMILVRPGDLVVSGINAAKGAIAVYDKTNIDDLAATIHYGAYIPNNERVNVQYLWWMLRSRFFRDLLAEYLPGGIKTELKAKRLLSIPVPLPPLEEQTKIIRNIEVSIARIDEAKSLRQQVIEQTQALVNSELRTEYNTLSEQHGTTMLSELIIQADYGSSKKCDTKRHDESIPVLRIPNIASEQITLRDLKYINRSSEANYTRLLLSKGDILVVRTNGSLQLCGRSAVVVDLPEPMIFASYLIRMKVNSDCVLPSFVQHMLRYLRIDEKLFDIARTTAGQYNVSLGRLRSVSIPVPPISIQNKIVAKFESLQPRINTLQLSQSENGAQLDALRLSILDHAFKGEL